MFNGNDWMNWTLLFVDKYTRDVQDPFLHEPTPPSCTLQNEHFIKCWSGFDPQEKLTRGGGGGG